MHSFNMPPSGPVGPARECRAQEERDIQTTLSSLQDWVRLCERCSEPGPQAEPREGRSAVVIPLKSRTRP